MMDELKTKKKLILEAAARSAFRNGLPRRLTSCGENCSPIMAKPKNGE